MYHLLKLSPKAYLSKGMEQTLKVVLVSVFRPEYILGLKVTLWSLSDLQILNRIAQN